MRHKISQIPGNPTDIPPPIIPTHRGHQDARVTLQGPEKAAGGRRVQRGSRSPLAFSLALYQTFHSNQLVVNTESQQDQAAHICEVITQHGQEAAHHE